MAQRTSRALHIPSAILKNRVEHLIKAYEMTRCLTSLHGRQILLDRFLRPFGRLMNAQAVGRTEHLGQKVNWETRNGRADLARITQSYFEVRVTEKR